MPPLDTATSPDPPECPLGCPTTCVVAHCVESMVTPFWDAKKKAWLSKCTMVPNDGRPSYHFVYWHKINKAWICSHTIAKHVREMHEAVEKMATNNEPLPIENHPGTSAPSSTSGADASVKASSGAGSKGSKTPATSTAAEIEKNCPQPNEGPDNQDTCMGGSENQSKGSDKLDDGPPKNELQHASGVNEFQVTKTESQMMKSEPGHIERKIPVKRERTEVQEGLRTPEKKAKESLTDRQLREWDGVLARGRVLLAGGGPPIPPQNSGRDEPCVDDVKKEIERYAVKIAEPGVFLDFVDAGILGELQGKDVAIIADKTDGSELELVSLSSALCRISPSPRLNLDSDGTEVDRKEAMVLLACNASYGPGIFNHWVPVLLEEQVPAGEYFDLTVKATTKLKRDVERLQATISALDEDNPLALASIRSYKDQIETRNNLLGLHHRLARLRATLVVVPGDGNCLLWSARRLLLGPNAAAPETREAIGEMLDLRRSMAQRWIDNSVQPLWQELFLATVDANFAAPAPSCPDSSTPAPQTPVKKKKKKVLKVEPAIDLITPPRPSPKKQPAPRIGSSQPAGIFKPSPTDARLKQPHEGRKRAAFVEPQAPDLEEAFSSLKRKIPDDPDQNLADVDLGALDPETFSAVIGEDDLLIGVPHKKRRAKHSRSCKKKETQPEEDQMTTVKMFFAKKGLTYAEFLKIHKRNCAISKAAVCDGGGFVPLQRQLKCGNLPSCKACEMLFEAHNISLESFDAFKEGQTEGMPEPEKVEEAQPDPSLTEYEQCLAFVKSYAPDIEVVEGDDSKAVLSYRCKVCTSKKQPNGKLNTLGKAKLHSVKWFLQMHLRSPTHSANLARRRVEAARIAESKESQQIVLPCPALNVADSSIGTLHLYEKEFALWAQCYRLSSDWTKHKVWLDCEKETWFVRHAQCKQSISAKETCCSCCASLAQPRYLQRNVVQFALKHCAARLLNAKLFRTQEDVDAIMHEMEHSIVGTRHPKYLSKLVQLKLTELQQLVRAGFGHLQYERMTDVLKDFKGSVIDPCLKVNPTAMNSKLPALSQQFASALADNNLTELESLGLSLAELSLTGKLDNHPFVQGLLAQMAHRIDRDERCLSSRGRKKECSETVRSLIHDSALQLSMLCGNRLLAEKLCQNVRPPPIILSSLQHQGLPNPMLALMCKEQLALNAELIDQRCPRLPDAPARRLVVAMDHTYILRSLAQATWKDQAGLVGRPWSPFCEEDAFLPLANLPEKATCGPKANLMLECLCWDPAAEKAPTYSLASMPMTLSRSSGDKSDRMAGNREMLAVLGRLLATCSWAIKAVAFDAHASHSWLREALLGQFTTVKISDLKDVEFFQELTWKDLPGHSLPRMPAKVCYHAGEPIWALCGTCHAVKNLGGQIVSVLRTCHFGEIFCDTTGMRPNGLPPAAYMRSEAQSDHLFALMMNPYFLLTSPDIIGKQASIPWHLKGMCLMNLMAALCSGPMMHKSMPLHTRCENAMTGFLCLDLFKMMADRLAGKRRAPKGSLFIHGTTLRNLQNICLSVIIVCASKHHIGNPWKYSRTRLTELPVECHFGRLRVQSPSANMTSRSYWKSAARELLTAAARGTPSQPPNEILHPLDCQAFDGASRRAYAAALKLVAFCSDVSEQSLQEYYESACDGGVFSETEEPLHPFEDDSPVSEQDHVEETAEDAKHLIGHMGEEAALDGELPDEAKLFRDSASLEAKKSPDLADLEHLFRVDEEKGRTGDVQDTTAACGGAEDPETLRQAMVGSCSRSSQASLFDRLWRLTMYLRHWKGGSDTQWISNARNFRSASSGLSWYQFNERKLAEIAREEGDQDFQKRASRLQTWMKVAQQAAAENQAKVVIPNKIEHGHVLLFVANKVASGAKVPKAYVGMVLTFWRCSRQPKLCVSGVDMRHCVAIRVVLLDISSSEQGLQGRATDRSIAMIIRPMSVVSVLDCVNSKQTDEEVIVTLSPECESTLNNMDDIPSWFPDPDPNAEYPFTDLGGVPVQKRKTKRRQTSEKSKQKVEKASKPKKKKKTYVTTRGKKFGLGRLKAGCKPGSIPCLPVNFRKNEKGRQLIRQMMKKVRERDESRHPGNPVFSGDGDVCRLQPAECSGVKWEEILERAPEFFSIRYSSQSNPTDWGKCVYEHFARLMKSETRRPFIQLVVNICKGTNAAL